MRIDWLTRPLRGLAALAVVVLPASAAAQRAGDGFLFGTPSGSLVVHAGYARASAGSDLFAFLIDELTLNRSDFSSATAGLDLAFRVGSRTDLVLSASYAGASAGSEFRRFVDQSNNPIRQTTQLRRAPLTIGARQFLASRGRSVGQFAWIPARVAPYVGAGAGVMWYRLRQDGDFIDFDTNEVFSSTLESSGWTPTVHVLGGVDYTLTPRLALNGEARYGWARGSPSSDFVGFGRIDLSGLSTTVGLSARF